MEDKNPANIDGITPLSVAAQNGHFEVCQLIIQNVEDKNPANKIGDTPLHYAAENGHLDICKLIMDNVEDKNPVNDYGQTPLSLATKNGHSGVSFLFIKKSTANLVGSIFTKMSSWVSKHKQIQVGPPQ